MANTTPQALDREAWLTEAAGLILDERIAPHADTPVGRQFRISIGFPSGKPSKIAAQCWRAAASADGVNEIFVSPTVDNSIEILGSLAHELVHYVDDCESGHKHHFARVARAIGLEGKLTATHPGAKLTDYLQSIVNLLGPIPHAKLTYSKSGRKTQGTRMLKVECSACGFTFRATRTHTDRITASSPCPACHNVGTLDQA